MDKLCDSYPRHKKKSADLAKNVTTLSIIPLSYFQYCMLNIMINISEHSLLKYIIIRQAILLQETLQLLQVKPV